MAAPTQYLRPQKRQIARATPAGSPSSVATRLAETLTAREKVMICQNSGERSAVQIEAISPVMVMFHHRRGGISVAAKLLVDDDLLRAQQSPRFKMRR